MMRLLVTSITSGSYWLNGSAFLLLPEEKRPKGNSMPEHPKYSIDDPQAQETAQPTSISFAIRGLCNPLNCKIQNYRDKN